MASGLEAVQHRVEHRVLVVQRLAALPLILVAGDQRIGAAHGFLGHGIARGDGLLHVGDMPIGAVQQEREHHDGDRAGSEEAEEDAGHGVKGTAIQ